MIYENNNTCSEYVNIVLKNFRVSTFNLTDKSSGPRWWHRRLLNSPFSHGHTECIDTHGAIPSERNPENSWVIPTHWVNEKISTLKQIGKTETHSHHKPHCQHSTKQSGRNSKLSASFWGAKCLDPTSSTQHLRLPSEGWAASRHLALKTNGTCIHETHKTIGNKETVLSKLQKTHHGYPPRIQYEGNRQKNTHLPFFPWEASIFIH